MSAILQAATNYTRGLFYLVVLYLMARTVSASHHIYFLPPTDQTTHRVWEKYHDKAVQLL